MKNPGHNLRIIAGGIILGTLILAGCSVNVAPEDYYPFDPPRNVNVVPGDNLVEVQWAHHSNRRVVGYRIYRSRSYDGRYTLLGSTGANFFIDYSPRNGQLYYYAVSAYDNRGNETALSVENAYTIPRPEGYDVLMRDFRNWPDRAGFEFSSATLGPYDDQYTDIFYEYWQGTHYMNVWDDSDIIDMGWTHSIKDVRFAPGQNAFWRKYVELRTGNTYVVWTYDNHFAKFRVIELYPGYAVIDWAYQTLEGEPLLKRPEWTGERKVLRNERLGIEIKK
jgi:hypothetical protein